MSPKLEATTCPPPAPGDAGHVVEAWVVSGRSVEEPTAGVIHEKARDGHGPGLARRQVGDHAGAIELDIAGAQGVDAHRSHLRGPSFGMI